VYYPGLESHPGHDVAKKQMTGFGGMVSFDLKDADPVVFQKKLKLIRPSMSLGGVDSIICSPVLTSHRHLSPPNGFARDHGKNAAAVRGDRGSGRHRRGLRSSPPGAAVAGKRASFSIQCIAILLHEPLVGGDAAQNHDTDDVVKRPGSTRHSPRR